MPIVRSLRSVFVVCLLLSARSGATQNLYCSEAPYWKVSSVTRSANDGELVLAIDTVDAGGTAQVISVSTTSGATRFVTQQRNRGWTFAIHLLEDDGGRTARIGTQAWCDARMRGYYETVLPIVELLDRT